MSGILDMLTEHLDSRTVRDLGKKIGADEDATQKAVAAALPMLIAGLARNANTSPSGAESLANALDRDHDGSLLGNLGHLFLDFDGDRDISDDAKIGSALAGSGLLGKLFSK